MAVRTQHWKGTLYICNNLDCSDCADALYLFLDTPFNPRKTEMNTVGVHPLYVTERGSHEGVDAIQAELEELTKEYHREKQTSEKRSETRSS